MLSSGSGEGDERSGVMIVGRLQGGDVVGTQFADILPRARGSGSGEDLPENFFSIDWSAAKTGPQRPERGRRGWLEVISTPQLRRIMLRGQAAWRNNGHTGSTAAKCPEASSRIRR
jgi:hypothetical protein